MVVLLGPSRSNQGKVNVKKDAASASAAASQMTRLATTSARSEGRRRRIGSQRHSLARSLRRTDGRTDFPNAICHLPSMSAAAMASGRARHVNGQWRDILMESLRKSGRASESAPFLWTTDGRTRTQFGHKIRNQSRRSFTMEKCCVALETASELKFQATGPGCAIKTSR